MSTTLRLVIIYFWMKQFHFISDVVFDVIRTILKTKYTKNITEKIIILNHLTALQLNARKLFSGHCMLCH